MTTLPADSVRAVVQGACVQVLRSKDNFLKSIFSFTICGLLANFKVTMAYIAGTLSQSKENESHICHLLSSEVVTTFLFIVYIAMGILCTVTYY